MKKRQYHLIKGYKRRFKKIYWKKNIIQYGSFGIISLESKLITEKQIITISLLVRRIIKQAHKHNRIWVRIFFDYASFKKSKHARMGKGCGKLDMFLSYIKRGSVVLEIPFVSMETFFKVFNIIKYKLCLKLDFCIRPPYVKEIYSKSIFVEPKKIKKQKSLKRKNKR